MKRFLYVLALGLLAFAAPARADQLIQIPTADLSPWSAEATFRLDGVDERYYSLRGPVGVAGEFFLRYYANLDKSYDTAIGGQLQLLPQGFGTPSLSVGVWDAFNVGPYGRRFFLILSKNFTELDSVPTFLHGTDIHFGFGTGRFGTVLLGVRRRLPGGFSLVAEFDSRRWNEGLWWQPVNFLRLRGEFQNGTPFVGGNLMVQF